MTPEEVQLTIHRENMALSILRMLAHSNSSTMTEIAAAKVGDSFVKMRDLSEKVTHLTNKIIEDLNDG